MGTLLKPDPDLHAAAEMAAAEAKHEADEHDPAKFVERPRKAPDVYISRPELGPNPDTKRRGDGR